MPGRVMCRRGLGLLFLGLYIEELIVDGFKSYSTRTGVGPFDKQFNARTGLNDSGKSNILGSVCFRS